MLLRPCSVSRLLLSPSPRTLHNWWWAQESPWFWRAVHRGVFQREGRPLQLLQWREDTGDVGKVCSLGPASQRCAPWLSVDQINLFSHLQNTDLLSLLPKKTWAFWKNRLLPNQYTDQTPRNILGFSRRQWKFLPGQSALMSLGQVWLEPKTRKFCPSIKQRRPIPHLRLLNRFLFPSIDYWVLFSRRE